MIALGPSSRLFKPLLQLIFAFVVFPALKSTGAVLTLLDIKARNGQPAIRGNLVGMAQGGIDTMNVCSIFAFHWDCRSIRCRSQGFLDLFGRL